MTKDKQQEVFDNIRKLYFPDDEMAELAINMVVEILEEQVDLIEREEPYATKTIDEMKTAIKRVSELRDYVDY